MGKRFRRIPKDSCKQTRSLQSLKKQTPLQTVVTQVLIEAGDAKELAETSHQVALTQIQKLCKEHGMISPLLFRTQAEILEKCYHNASSRPKRKKYLEEAKRCITIAFDMSKKKNMAFLTYLGFLMLEGATDAQGGKEAIDILNEAYMISNDPLGSVILSSDETEEFIGFFPTYEDRVENARNNIVNILGFCVLFLKRMGCYSLTILDILQKLGVKNVDKVKLYWLSLSLEEKNSFLQVKNLTSYLITSKKYLANQVLSQALSFYEACGKWEFWSCCCCNKTFSTSALHFLHVTTTHLKELTSDLKSFFPALSVNGCDWALVIKTMKWKPVNASVAIPMLQHKWKLLRSSKVGNNTVVKKNRSKPESSSNVGEVRSLKKERGVQETPIEGSTFEFLRYDVNPWAKTEIFKWKWPFVKDPKRGGPLSDILKILKKLLSQKYFLAAHMNILIQRSLSMLDGPLGDLVRDLGLEQTHYPLCLLKASQLQEIHNLLQEMSDFTTKRFEQQNFVEETLDCSMKALKINGAISLSMESLYLILDESSFQNESTSGNSSVKDEDAPVPDEPVFSNDSTSGNSATKDDDASAPNKQSSINEPTSGNYSSVEDDDTAENSIPPSVEAMVSWIYSDHSSDESLKEWRNLKDERRCRGEKELVAYKELFAKRLKKVQEGPSEKAILTDASRLEVRKDTDSASQKPQVDSFVEAMIQKGSENNYSELTEIDKLTLQVAMDMHQMQIKLNCFAAYDYQPIVLSIAKAYLREYAEGIVDTTKKSDGAADCGTEGPEDEIKTRNQKALLESQAADQNVADTDTKDPEDGTQMLNWNALLEFNVDTRGNYGGQVSMTRKRSSLQLKQSIVGALTHEAENEDVTNALWVIDSGASVSCTGNRLLLENRTPLREPKGLTQANGEVTFAKEVGDITITGFGLFAQAPNKQAYRVKTPKKKTYKVKGVLYVPEIRDNLLSVSQFTMQNNCMIEFRCDRYAIRDLHPTTCLKMVRPDQIIWMGLMESDQYCYKQKLSQQPQSPPHKGRGHKYRRRP